MYHCIGGISYFLQFDRLAEIAALELVKDLNVENYVFTAIEDTDKDKWSVKCVGLRLSS